MRVNYIKIIAETINAEKISIFSNYGEGHLESDSAGGWQRRRVVFQHALPRQGFIRGL